MIGVRLFSRGSHIVRLDVVRCLLAAVLLLAANAGRNPTVMHAGDSDPGSKTVDPFLDEDKAVPADDEIPSIPETEFESPKKPSDKPDAKPDKRAEPDKKPEIRPESQADSKSKSAPAIDPDATPNVQRPRVTRQIKKTAVPKLSDDEDLLQDLDQPDKMPTQ